MGKVDKGSVSFIKTQADVKSAMDGVEKTLQAALSQLMVTTADELTEVGLTIQNTSNMIAPLDEGDLIASSYVSTKKEGDKVTVEIGYTDDKAPYVHENTPSKRDYENPTTSGTHWKFLQKAVTEVEPDINIILADALRNKLS